MTRKKHHKSLGLQVNCLSNVSELLYTLSVYLAD